MRGGYNRIGSGLKIPWDSEGMMKILGYFILIDTCSGWFWYL